MADASLIHYLEFVKKAYHKFISERIQIRKSTRSDNNATVVWDEIIADLTPEQRKTLQDVQGFILSPMVLPLL